MRAFLRLVEKSPGDKNLPAFIGEVSRNIHKVVHAQEDVFGQLQVLYIMNRGLASKTRSVGEKTTGRLLSAGDVWGIDFLLSDVSLLDPPECFALTYVELMMLERDTFMSIVQQRALSCPIIRERVRKFTVRMAVQRGLLAEARARMARAGRQSLCLSGNMDGASNDNEAIESQVFVADVEKL